MLAESLWEFYNYQLYCTVWPDDGEPNRHRVDGIKDPQRIDTIRVFISVRDNDRRAEGLVHELLHANLIPLGYPRFWLKEKSRLAAGIINLADHIVMRPIFIALGYCAGRFLGATRSLTEQEKRVAADLQKMAADLATPESYLTHVSAYLKGQGIKFEPLHLAETVLSQRFLALRNRLTHF